MNKEIKNNNIYVTIKDKGYIIYQINGEVIDIINIFVKEEYRNKGYASKLLLYLEKENADKIMLEVRKDNDIAISLYKKHNYKLISVRKSYYKDGMDALIMEKVK